MQALAICKLKAGLAPCEGLIAKLGFASSRPCIGIVPAHPARNTIRLLCSSLSSSPSVQDLASQRRTNTFRRLLFGLCNCQPSLTACVRDERFVCECRTNSRATPTLESFAIEKVSSVRNQSWECGPTSYCSRPPTSNLRVFNK